MALSIKHSFYSEKLDGPDPTVVRPVNWNAEHLVTGSGWLLAGMVVDFVGHTIPDYLLECFGQSVAASSYPALFATMVKQGVVTLTAGTPGVVNWVGHGLPPGSKIRFKSSIGASGLPAEIATDTDYYVISAGWTAASFRISATAGGAAFTFGSFSASTITAINAQFGASVDLSSFSVPDLRGRVTVGLDTMGGVAAGRVTMAGSGVDGALLGASGGAQNHTLTLAQLASHQHNNNPPDPTIAIGALTVTVNPVSDHSHTVTGTNVAALDHTHAGSGGTIGSGGAHSHALAGNSGDDSPDHAHGQAGRHYGASYGGAGGHAHTFTVDTATNTSQGSTGDRIARIPGTPGAARTTDAVGGHEHAVYVDIGGYTIGASARHQHSLASGVAVAVGDHTHPVTGLTIAAGGAHNHVWSGTVANAGGHTHTATATGTITSALADFLSDMAGANEAHPNMQPTFMVRKLVYVG